MRYLNALTFRSLFVAVLVVALHAPAAAQYTYGRYLEPPEGLIFQGIGHWPENAEYMTAIGTYGTKPYPGHEHKYADIPSEPTSNGHNNHPFTELATSLRLALREMATTSGQRRIPEISISFRNWGDGGSTHDDEVFEEVSGGPSSNAYMEQQITLLGHVLADYSIADAPYNEAPGTFPGRPVFVSIGQEFNNPDAYHEWAFPECWHRTKQLLQAAGATQVSYIWCWEASVPLPFSYNGTTHKYGWYPGNHAGDEPDWWGVDVFDQDDFMDGFASDDFDNVEYFLDVAEYAGRPVFITEASCVGFAIDGGASGDEDVNDSWGNWFEPFISFVYTHPGIRAVAYVSHDWTGPAYPGWHDGTITNSTLVMDNWVALLNGYSWLGAETMGQFNGYDGWYGLGHAKGGHSYLPQLAGTGRVLPGGSVHLSLTGAKPDVTTSDGFLIVGAGAYSPPASFQGGYLVPHPDVLIPIATDSAGAYTLNFTWPSYLTPGSTLWYQVWINHSFSYSNNAWTGWTASNAVSAKTLDY